MNKLNYKQNRDRLTIESRLTPMGARLGVEGLSKQEKELMDMDNSVVIVGRRGGIRGLNGNRKNTKIKD